jgi:hypothetical protein
MKFSTSVWSSVSIEACSFQRLSTAGKWQLGVNYDDQVPDPLIPYTPVLLLSDRRDGRAPEHREIHRDHDRVVRSRVGMPSDMAPNHR